MDIQLNSPELASLKADDPSLAKPGVIMSVTEFHPIPEDQPTEYSPSLNQPTSTNKKNTAIEILQRAVWKAITCNSQSYSFHEVTIQNIGIIPVDQDKPLDLTSETPPESFFITGKIALFENKEWMAEFYSYLGPPPGGVAQGQDDRLPMYHMAILKHELRISTLFPGLAGSPFDSIAIKDPAFTYQNMPIDTTKIVGCTIEARIDFDQSCGVIHDMLSKILGFQTPSLSISGGLATEFSWKTTPKLKGFQLTGVFTDAEPPKPPCQMITLSRLGARIIGFDSITMDERTYQSSISLGFEVFGGMTLQIPGCDLPLDLDFHLQEIRGSVSLSASLEGEWENALGIRNLTIEDVHFGADFDLTAAFDTLHLTMGASFNAGPVFFEFQGHYSTNGNYGLTATVRDFSLQSLSDLYYHFYEKYLELPDIDIEIGEVTISIEKGKGFGLIIHDLKIGDYACCDGLVTINDSGIEVEAQFTSETLTIHDIQIKDVYFQFTLDRSDSKSKASVMVKGEAEWQGHGLAVGAHVYQNPEPGKNNLEFTIVAAFKAASKDGGLPLIKLIPQLEKTFMKDVVLQGIALTAASRDDAEFGSLNKADYQVKKGIRVCAAFGKVAELTTVSGGTHDSSLIFYAGWDGKNGFDITLSLPKTTTWKLGPKITTDPLELSLVLGTKPEIKVKSGMLIPIEGQENDPLHFSFTLGIGPTSASATGALITKEGWKNPFNLCPELVIGPALALKIEIDYATFTSKGPSSIAFVGGASIGKKSVQFAFSYNDNPLKSLLYGEMENIGLQELVQGANDLFNIDLPQVPNVLFFELLKIYICPGGVEIAPLYYQPGFSFSSKVIIYGIHAKLMCSISSTGFIANGAVDNFTLGPNNMLVVRGVTGEKALYDFEITKSKQSGVINGLITFLDAEVSLTANFALYPNPAFDFHFQLKFEEVFNFDVQGHPMQQVTSRSTSIIDQDWRLDAVFTSEIRGHVSVKLNKMFQEKAQQAQNDAEFAQIYADAEHKKWQDDISTKRKAADTAQKIWLVKKNNAESEHYRKIEEHRIYVAELKEKWVSAARALEKEIIDAPQALLDADRERYKRTQAALLDLGNAERECEENIAKAEKSYNEQLQAFNRVYPNAQGKVDSLRDEVNEISAELNRKSEKLGGIPKTIQVFRNLLNVGLNFGAGSQALFEENREYTIALGEVTNLTSKLAERERDYVVAKAVLESQNYLNDQKLVASASQYIGEVGRTGSIKVAKAKDNIQQVNKEVNDLVTIATKRNQNIEDKVHGAFHVAVNVAKKNWEEAEKQTEPVRIAAVKILADAEMTAECLAWKAAEQALKKAEEVSKIALAGLELGIDIATEAAKQWLELCKQAVVCATDICNITDVNLTCQLGKAVGGAAFDANVKGTVSVEGQSQAFEFNVAYNVNGADAFVRAIHDDLVEWANTTKDLFKDVDYGKIARMVLCTPNFNDLSVK